MLEEHNSILMVSITGKEKTLNGDKTGEQLLVLYVALCLNVIKNTIAGESCENSLIRLYKM